MTHRNVSIYNRGRFCACLRGLGRAAAGKLSGATLRLQKPPLPRAVSMHCSRDEKPQLVAPSPEPLISAEHQVPARALSGAEPNASSASPPIMTIRRIGKLRPMNSYRE